MSRHIRPLSQLFGFTLAALLTLLPLSGVSALGIRGTLAVEDLRAFLEAPGSDSLRITEDTAAVDYAGTALTVNGHKTILVGDGCSFTLMSALEIPEGASLTLQGSGRFENGKAVHASNPGGLASFTVRGTLFLRDINLQLSTVADEQVGIDITGGSVTASGTQITVVAMSNGTGIRNTGTFSMAGGTLSVPGSGHVPIDRFTGFDNAGVASFADVRVDVAGTGPVIAIVNGDPQGAGTASMTFAGGACILQNTGGIGILNLSDLRFANATVKFGGQSGPGLHNSGGNLSFADCGLGFEFILGGPTHLINDEGGQLDIAGSGVVTYGGEGTCIASASGSLHDGGGNALLHLARATWVDPGDRNTISWNENFYQAQLTLVDAVTGDPIGESFIQSAWPGRGFTLHDDAQLSTHMWVFSTGGETVTLRADGYKTTRFTAPAADAGETSFTVALQPGRDMGMGPYLAAGVLLLSIVSIFYQQRRGKTFTRPVKQGD